MKKSLLIAAILLAPSISSVYAADASPKIEIHAKRYDFVPAAITLKKGEPVTLDIISDDVPHSLVIKDLDVNVKVAAGQQQEITITPQQTGDFKGTCGVFCGSGHGKMQLEVHVVEGN